MTSAKYLRCFLTNKQAWTEREGTSDREGQIRQAAAFNPLSFTVIQAYRRIKKKEEESSKV